VSFPVSVGPLQDQRGERREERERERERE